MSDLVYLKPNLAVIPLFNGWYAWPHLISPACAPFNVSHHIRLMRSYVSAPKAHAAALRNPKMVGGPFLNLNGGKVAEVKELLAKTEAEQGELLALAEDIKQLELMLQERGKGYSLESLYEEVPERLKGYVELVYTMDHHAQLRLLEPLMYQGPHYRPENQSVALGLITKDERPLILSTPWLNDGMHVELGIPFNHEALDALFKMRLQPGSLDDIINRLEVPEGSRDLFASFFTSEAPKQPDNYTGDGVRVRYFGHACLLFESKDVSILVDPAISCEYETDLPRYTLSDLPDHIDYVIFTHGHHDHLMFETLLPLRSRVGQFVVPRNRAGNREDVSLRLILEHTGFENVVELDDLQSIKLKGGAITGLPFLGEHCDLDIYAKLGYHIELEGRKFLALADSNNLDPTLYRNLHRVLGDVDAIFLGMECEGGPLSWLYGPLLSKPLDRKMDQSRRLSGSDCEKALDLIDCFNPKACHIYAMGMEPWYSHIMGLAYDENAVQVVESNKLIEAAQQRGLQSERPFGKRLYTF